MICTTTKKGEECFFMTKNGCSYNGGTCHPVVEQCEGCERIREYAGGKYCSAYPNPGMKWKNATCNFATHVKKDSKQERVVNALKASKRKAAGKM